MYIILYCIVLFYFRWTEIVDLCDTTEEKTELYIDMGSAFCEMETWEEGKEFGEMAVESAKETKDNKLQLAATLLLAKAIGIVLYCIINYS